jgi:hypothetical protein
MYTVLPCKLDTDYHKVTFSSQICTGRMDCATAIVQLQPPTYNKAATQQDMDYVARKLAVPHPELDHIIDLPVQSYADNPNDKKRLVFLYRLYPKLFTLPLFI